MSNTSRKAQSRLPEADRLYARPSPDRPVYKTGVRLDEGHFLDEQTYHRGRLAQALVFLSGGGTLAGLRVTHAPETADHGEEIRVDAGLLVDRLGRLVEVPRPACLRLQPWWESTFGSDGGDTLKEARYPKQAPTPGPSPSHFLSSRALAEAGVAGAPAVPARAVIVDVFLRFVACERGATPSFASGPFDALDAIATSRLRDAYELVMVPRSGLDDDLLALPNRGPDMSLTSDPQARRNLVHEWVLEAWPKRGDAGSDDTVTRGPEHPLGIDPTAQLLARVLIPVTSALSPQRDGTGVLVDNWSRRFIPSNQLLQRCIGL